MYVPAGRSKGKEKKERTRFSQTTLMPGDNDMKTPGVYIIGENVPIRC
jgi:hypothetical protein